ncbi:MAG: signal recognition particle-docking protein FtsY [Deferribacterales bacterium]|nr:signal recognition particle-docking protein FtsY [Deferribacterales bacterium]
MGFFDFLKKDKSSDDKLKKGMSKTSNKITDGLARIFLGKKKIDAELLEELEELLISADIGPVAADEIITSVKNDASRGVLKDPEKLNLAIKDKIIEMLSEVDIPDPEDTKPYVILVAGVNGVGKTTSIAKLANLYKKGGKSVLLAAGDTFRAAAADQLTVWAERLDVAIVKQPDGSDPAAVVHDAASSAKSKNIDILIADTAGRLHTKANLMQELMKIQRVVSKEIPNAPHEKLLVLDATGGQNAVSQAKAFKDAIGITGLVLTKLDGTAKGGVVIRIVNELKIPVKYIGFGEGIEDLRPFDAKDFAEALFTTIKD